MKILWLIDYFPRPHYHSAGIWAYETVKALAQQGHRISVLSPTPFLPRFCAITAYMRLWCCVPWKITCEGMSIYYPKALFYPRRFIRRWIYWHIPYLHGEFLWRTMYKDIAAIIAEEKPDVLHANFVFPSGYLAMKIKEHWHIPFVLHERSTQAFLRNSTYPRLNRGYRRVANTANHIITMNAQLQKGLQDMVAARIPVSIVTSATSFQYYPHDGEHRPQEYAGKVLVLCVGAFIPRKRQRDLVESLALLSQQERARIACVFIGSGEQLTHVRDLVAQRDVGASVTFLGQVSHATVMQWMAWSDIFVLPSEEEASGTVYSEAMGAATPVIMCDDCGMATVITQGKEGFIVPVGEHKKLKEALAACIASPHILQAMGRAAKSLAEEQLTYAYIGSRISDIYNKVVEDGS